jgi:hypothetical protein
LTPDLHGLDLVTLSDSLSHAIASSQALLADAAAASAEPAKELGWWDQYVLLFQKTLVFVHSVIDQPLKSIGVTQTWGISIAVFTASK